MTIRMASPEDATEGYYRMTHYIEDGGPFDVACRALLAAGFKINWADRIVRPTAPSDDPNDPDNKPAKQDRIKFSYPSCGLNAWAKPSAKITCADCAVLMPPTQ